MTKNPAFSREIEKEMSRQIGRNLRIAREFRGWSQEDLARLWDISFQQVQKYEKGANRVSLEKILTASRALKMPLSAFSEGLDYAPALPDLEPLTAPQRNRIFKILRRLPALSVPALDTIIALCNLDRQEDDSV